MPRLAYSSYIALIAIGVLSAQDPTGSGTLRIYDRGYATNDVLFCDSLHVSMTNVSPPDPGTEYHAWLFDDAAETYHIGQVDVTSGTISFGYASPDKNIVQTYAAFAISQETTGFSGTAPTASGLRFGKGFFVNEGGIGTGHAFYHIRNIIGAFDTPNNLGLMTQMVRQLFKNDNLVQHATLATTQSTAANVKVHTNHAYDFVTGLPDPRIASGSVANNSDPLGYGFRRYVDFDGSITAQAGVVHHLGLALAQSDTTVTMGAAGREALSTLYRVFGTDNASGMARDFTDKCLEIIGKTYATVSPAQADAVVMKTIAQKLQDSIFVAYRHVLDMATITIEPVQLPPAAPTLLFPADSAVGIALDTVLQWTTVAEADSYKVQLIIVHDGGITVDDVVLDTVIVDTSLSLSELKPSSGYFWTVSSVKGELRSGPATGYFTTTTGTRVTRDPSTPGSFALMQNYPNPFNPTTDIRFQTTDDKHIRLSVLDVLGREIAVLVDGVIPGGDHSVTWDASGVPSGVYVIRMEVTTDGVRVFQAIRRGVLLR